MKILLGLFLIAIGLSSCSTTNNPTECADMACTKDFRTITVKFIDSNGNPQIVKDFTSINKRTGELMTSINDMAGPGLYVVASDSDLLKLSEKGDNVQITATDLKTNTKLQADYVISGGSCSCHVTKISGPDTVKF